MEAESAAAAAKKAASLTQAAPTTQAHDQRGAEAIAGTADDEYSAAGERSNGRPTPFATPHRGVKAGGRFTIRPSGDSQGSRCATGAFATFCGQQAGSPP